jgi:hypothetical protein
MPPACAQPQLGSEAIESAFMLYQERRRRFDSHSARRTTPPTYKKEFVAPVHRRHDRFSHHWPEDDVE